MTSPTESTGRPTGTTSEFFNTTQRPTTDAAYDVFDLKRRFVVGIVAVLIYLAVVCVVAVSYSLYKRYRCRVGAKWRRGPQSIAEYCNRSYDSASSIDHDAIFSVHFSAATGDVRLPTSRNVDDRRRLDADFHAPDDCDHDICPYATFTEIEALRSARDRRVSETIGQTSGYDNQDLRPADGMADAERARPQRPRGASSASNDLPRRSPEESHLNAIYAKPHKVIPKNDTIPGNQQCVQSKYIHSTA